MRRLSLVVILVLASLILRPPLPATSASTGTLYSSTWGGGNPDYGQGVAVDSAGNSFTTGYTWSFTAGTPSVFLLKYSFTGALQTQRIWSDGAYDYAFGDAVDNSRNVYVVGWTNNLGGPSILLLKFNNQGGLLWQKTVGGGSNPAYGQAVSVDSTGSIYVAGYYASTSGTDQNATLVKFDPSGNVIWQRSWGGSSPEQAKGVAVDNSGNIYVTGLTNSFGGGATDVFLLKFNSAGGLLNAVTWGGGGDDKANSVAVDPSGNVYVAGSTNSPSLTNQAFLLKFTSSGSLAWKYLYALTGDTVGNAVAFSAMSSRIWLAGNTMVGSNSRGFILTFNLTGSMLDQETWGGSAGFDSANGLANDPSGNVMMTGYVSETGPYSFSTVKGTLSNANLTTTNPTTLATDPGLSVGVATGTVVTPNGSTNYAGGADVYVTKFGTIPTILFLASPRYTGQIVFAGNTYSTGDSGSYVYNSYQATAKPRADYVFHYWNTSGGLSVGDNIYRNPVTVTVSGPGVLTAVFSVRIVNITIDVVPVAGGTVTCNGVTGVGNQTTFQIRLNTTLACTANRYAGNTFLQWSGLFNGTDTQMSFNVTRGGILEADFRVPLLSLPPPAIVFSGLMLMVIVVSRREKK